MSNRTGQLNMTHTLTTHLSEGNFYATLFTHDTAMLHALIFTTETFVVFYWAKYLGTEKTFSFWLERSIVNRFRLFNFTKRP